MEPNLYTNNATQAKNTLNSLIMFAVLLAIVALPTLAFAQEADFQATGAKVCGFFSNMNKILNMTSITVVTVAVVFSGYQIAFAHKRIGDVAPILIGGVLIGAASQVAKMVIGDTGQECAAQTTLVLHHIFSTYA
jgi:type IV secretion system protein VirB2